VKKQQKKQQHNIVKLLKYELFLLFTFLKKRQQIYWFYHIIQLQTVTTLMLKTYFCVLCR